MYPKKRKTNKKNKCNEEITDLERLKKYGIFPDDKKDEDYSKAESWRNYT